MAGGVSQFGGCILEESRRVFYYEIKPLCYSVQISKCIPGIYVITRVIRV